MAFPFIPVLAVAGLGALGYWAFKKPTPQPAPRTGPLGSWTNPIELDNVPPTVPVQGVTPVTIPSPSGAITIDLPVGISSDVYTVVNAPNQLLLRSSPNIDGHAPGQGNVVGALPNGTLVKKVPGSDLQGQNSYPAGFMNITTIPDGQKGFAAADYLAKVTQSLSA